MTMTVQLTGSISLLDNLELSLADLNDEFEQMEMHDEADTLNGRDDSIACFTQHEGGY